MNTMVGYFSQTCVHGFPPQFILSFAEGRE